MKVSERELHKMTVKMLKEKQKEHDFIFFHVKNDVGDKRTKFYDPRPLGVLAGVADFCILKQGKTIFLEIKNEMGRLSDHQRDFLSKCNALGHDSFCAFGWADICDKLRSIFDKFEGSTPRAIPTSANMQKYHGLSGSILWLDEEGKMHKRRGANRVSIFLY